MRGCWNSCSAVSSSSSRLHNVTCHQKSPSDQWATISVRFSVLNVSAMVSSVASVGSGVRVVLVPCGPRVA